jgi:hypothetical protein
LAAGWLQLLVIIIIAPATIIDRHIFLVFIINLIIKNYFKKNIAKSSNFLGGGDGSDFETLPIAFLLFKKNRREQVIYW